MTRDAKKAVRQEAIDRLRELVKPGTTIYTTLRHVSRSGMQRVIDAHLIVDSEPYWIGSLVAKAIDDRYDDERQGVVIGGCGMDMGFAIVHSLSYALYPDGYECLDPQSDGYSRTCPAADHANAYYIKRDGGTVPTFHKDGYALKHKWM